ncbi:unnamed protein product [Caenorhabditis sp. 36 PRJEB53466]|nr:unnamed protein product [Caenorhabditis sp. 36 PRJEB53466]
MLQKPVGVRRPGPPQTLVEIEMEDNSKKLTKKELKTLKNALGRQGLTLEDHEKAQESPKKCEILQIDCFSLDEGRSDGQSDGWYVGYGVEYNGVGVSTAQESSVSSEEENRVNENREMSGESSGFDSDPPTDDEEPAREHYFSNNLANRRESDDVSDKGQLLYGIVEYDGQSPKFYVDKNLAPKNVTLHTSEESRNFKTGNFSSTNRFEVTKSSENEEETDQGYQMIGDGNVQCVTSHSEDDGDDSEVNFPEYLVNSATNSGLWCNFIVSPTDFDSEAQSSSKKLTIPAEKLKTIPLDEDKLAQISAAMANFKLPTPPGWEDVTDAKLLDFIKQKMTTKKRYNEEVDCELAKRSIWLVKVPRYLSELWEANEGSVVGKLHVEKEIELHTAKGLTQPTPKDEGEGGKQPTSSDASEIPTQYSFLLHDVKSQTMSVLSEDKQGMGSEASIKTGKLSIEGRIIKKAECRPPATSKYMKMKLAHIVKNTQPKKQVKLIEKAAIKFKPVSMHAEDMIRSKQKKDGAKTYRADRDVLRQALFKAFEKHSFYRLQDLQQLLQQPVSYVKDVLQEIAVYNTAPPHKSLWCLKPEYCNYKVNASGN